MGWRNSILYDLEHAKQAVADAYREAAVEGGGGVNVDLGKVVLHTIQALYFLQGVQRIIVEELEVPIEKP